MESNLIDCFVGGELDMPDTTWGDQTSLPSDENLGSVHHAKSLPWNSPVDYQLRCRENNKQPHLRYLG